MNHPVYGNSFSPERLADLRLAFDQAWAEVMPSLPVTDHEKARHALAETVMHLGCQGVVQTDMLRISSVRLFLRERCANDVLPAPLKGVRPRPLQV